MPTQDTNPECQGITCADNADAPAPKAFASVRESQDFLTTTHNGHGRIQDAGGKTLSQCRCGGGETVVVKDATPVAAASGSFILSLSDAGEGTPLPMGLSGMPTTDDEGQPIHYRKMRIARCGEWTHCGTGEPLSITRERADEWVRNTRSLSAAGRKPFVPVRHTFGDPDARDNQGYVVDIARAGDDVFATVALHGDEALKVAAKNNRSVGIKANGRDAKGNVFAGEWLHHLALVPNPALPDLGGMVKVAASADAPSTEVPIYQFQASAVAVAKPPPPVNARQQGCSMTPEIATKARDALGLSADAVPDDKLDNTVAEKAIALSADHKTLATERDTLKRERDELKTALSAKESEVLSLSATTPTNDPIALALITKSFQTDRERVIESGVISQAAMDAIDALMLSEGKPTRAALALSAGSYDPFYSRLCDIIRRSPGHKSGRNGGNDAAEPVERKTFGASADEKDAAPDEARRAQLLSMTTLGAAILESKAAAK